MTEVAWQVFGDDARSDSLASGVFPAQWIRSEDAEFNGDSVSARVSTLHPQLVPDVEHEARRLLALDDPSQHERCFPVNAGVFGLRAATGSDGSDGNDSGEVHCVLTKANASRREEETFPMHGSWLDVKLHRAEFHRQRGNDRFKRDRLDSAVRAYEKGLQWLACPTEHCAFSTDELARVNAIAIPCHANLATCYWKRHDMDTCIHHATCALTLDAAYVKARYRRSQAYLQTKQFDDAVADLEAVVAADPESQLFSTGLDKAKLARQQHRTKQKQALATAFSL